MLHIGEITVQDKENQIAAMADFGSETLSSAPGNLIDARGVDQLDALQRWRGELPGDSVLLARAAMGHVRLQQVLSDKGIDQAGFAHPHTTDHGDA